MRPGWAYKPFEDCICKVPATAKIQRKDFRSSGQIPIVSQEDGLINGYWDCADDAFLVTIPVTIFGDHTRSLKYVDFDFVLGADGVKVFQPLPFLNPKYFFYQLSSLKIPSLGYSRHYRVLKRAWLAVPPLDEQRQIVDVLDEALAAIATAIANAETNIMNTRELFAQASFHWLSEGSDDWPQYALDEVCMISSKLVDPRLEDFIDLPHIGAGNMESRTGELGNVLSAREEGLVSGKFLFDPTMVLYSKIRPYLMKACRPDFSGLCSADVYPLAPTDGKLDRNFLFHVLLGRRFTAYAEAGSARAGMPKVNRDHLFAYRFRLPPIEKQREIAERIDTLAESCRDLTRCLEGKLHALSSLKQSLLHQAFDGALQITVSEPLLA